MMDSFWIHDGQALKSLIAFTAQSINYAHTYIYIYECPHQGIIINILYHHLCFYRPLYHHLSPIYPHMGIADMRVEKGQERNLALNIHTVAVTDVTPMRCCPGAQKLDFIKLLDAGNSSLGKTCAQIGCSRHMLCAEKSLLSRVRDL
jgi:hypothetical protein